MYYINDENTLAVAQIPKAGLITMNDWLCGFKVVANDEPRLNDCATRVMFVRNPIARLQSAYSWFIGMSQARARVKHNAPLGSWPEYVDHILEHDNEHWRRQVEHAGGMQTVVHRLEDSMNIFFRYHPKPFKRNHVSKRVPASNYRLKDIVEFYAEDFDLWMGAEL